MEGRTSTPLGRGDTLQTPIGGGQEKGKVIGITKSLTWGITKQAGTLQPEGGTNEGRKSPQITGSTREVGRD